MKKMNRLQFEHSPYLLQHARNPVDWYPWGEEAFEKSRKEEKLLLVSIGYAACHWCHVMEEECFGDEKVAQLMNSYFICIKVDREERPDIDHTYMSAVQIMTGRGGWPLNCFILPDGQAVYGGTYFPKEKWMLLLSNLHKLYKEKKKETLDYAVRLTQQMRLENFGVGKSEDFDKSDFGELFRKSVQNWSASFDCENGGMRGAPKFPMPGQLLFLLRYGALNEDASILKFVHISLQKMAMGGIFDQLGGGFARYSTDEKWKVPHFEKMLYDNAQLIGLYSEAYRQEPIPLYREVAFSIFYFLEREMLSADGGGYSSLDADSEGVEGKYYVWTEDELREYLGGLFDVFSDFFSIGKGEIWEEEKYILQRKLTAEAVALKHNLAVENLLEQITNCRKILLAERSKRVSPALDDKAIAAWNGLLCSGLCEAYLAFGDTKFLKMAEGNADFILEKLSFLDAGLFRCRRGSVSYGKSFLDDYAFVSEGLIKLFCATGSENYLEKSEALIWQACDRFWDPEQDKFRFSDLEEGGGLTFSHYEVEDGVIPSSNSVMLWNLTRLSELTGKERFGEMADKLWTAMRGDVGIYLPGYANWGGWALTKFHDSSLLVVVGNNVDEIIFGQEKAYHPNTIFVISKRASDLELLKGKYKDGENLFYVCRGKTCFPPVCDLKEAEKLLKWTT